MKPTTSYFLIATALALASPVFASRHTVRECREGADFIKNAAMSRNNGQPRDAFLERLNGDLAMIRGMPIGVRWFARDKADEALLIKHAERVYDAPSTPEVHQEEFLGECSKNVEESRQGQMVWAEPAKKAALSTPTHRYALALALV